MKLRSLPAAVAFLTILPMGPARRSLNDAAAGIHFFPIIGALVGLAAGAFALGVSFIFPSLLVGFLTVAFLMFLTGLHHMDGLLDFGDGLMTAGGPREKIAAMRDTRTGVAGWTLGTMVLLTTASTISELNPATLLVVLVSTETTARFTMVVMAWAGKPVDGTTAQPFIAAMHGKTGHLRLASALTVTLVLVTLLSSTRGLMALGGALVAVLLVQALAHRQFAGLTGDVFGAGNELSRVAFLLVYIASTGT